MDRQASVTIADLEFMLIDKDAKPQALPFSLLEVITSGFSDEQIIGKGASAVVYKGSIGKRTVAVKKFVIADITILEKVFNREVECLMKVKHKNVVRFLGYCSHTQGQAERYEKKHVMADVQARLLCFEYLSGSLDKYITDASCGLEWKQRYQIINGVCQGLHRLHKDYKIFHLDLTPRNILLDDDMVPKIADFGLSRCLDEDQSKVQTKSICGTPGYLAPEIIESGEITNKSDLYSFGVIIKKIMTGDKECRTVDEVLESWIKRLDESLTNVQVDQIKVCAEIGIECSDFNPDNRPKDTEHIIDRLEKAASAKENQESGKLLDVQPTLLLFDLQPGKLIPCSLQLTNDTDEHMAFKLSTTESVDWSKNFTIRLPLYGIVPARSTYTVILTVLMGWWDAPINRSCYMTLQSCPSAYDYIWKFSNELECDDYFKVNKTENVVNEVKLTAFLCQEGQSISEPAGPGVRILSIEKPRTILLSMDAHPTKPWIITGHDCGHVCIYCNLETTQMLLYSFKVSLGPVYSVKFIARKQWFISSSAEGFIHVYSYETNMQKIMSFRAHDGIVISLAVHPTQPYVLSWPCSGQQGKKLWDWDKEWKCTQTFETEHFARDFICQVAFDPKETNRFASASNHHTVKVWSLDSPKSDYTLTGPFNGVNFLEFFTRDDKQYLIIGCVHDITAAKIWDLQKKKYIPNQRRTSMSLIPSVFSNPNLPIPLTRSSHCTSHLWSPKNFRLEGVLDYSCGGDVRGISFLMGSKRRVVIGQAFALTILDIDNWKYLEDSRESSEPRADTRPEDTSSEVINQGSSELLHVHPLKLHFPFDARKLIPCLLHLTNNTDKHVAFRLRTMTWNLPLRGIVPSRSTYTLVVTTRELPNYLLQEQNFNLLLQSSISGDRYIYTFKNQSECDQFFADAIETGNAVHDVKLEAVLSLQGQTTAENESTGQDEIQPLINIRGLFHPFKDFSSELCSLDADPTESWIITGHRHGDVSIWKHGTQRMMSSINTWEEKALPRDIFNRQHDVYSVKFITRKRWFVAGTYDGFIHVYKYETRMDNIKRFKAHSSGIVNSGIYSSRALVVHPTQPYVLSTFEEMKLWDWENNWKCLQTFAREHSDSICQVAFSPKYTNTFASASSDRTIKFWSLNSPTSEYTLRGHSDKVNCLDYFTRDGQQYLISGSQDCTAKIWSLQEKTCVHTMDAFMSPVVSVISLPDTPYITTGSEDGTIHLWSSASFRLERILNIGCSGPVRSLCLMGSKRIVIEQVDEISIMDIDTISEASSSALSNELIQVDPQKLRFPVAQEVSRTLKISNTTDHHVAFGIWSSNDAFEYNASPDKGVLSPKSTQQVVVKRVAHKSVPADLTHKELVYVTGTVVVEGLRTTDVTYDMFDQTKTGRNVQKVQLDVVFVPSEIVSKVRLPWTLDVHPTKPLIMMTQGDYHIHIRDYDAGETRPIAIKGREVTSAKFIPRKQWIIAGCSSGIIYVYTYDPSVQKKSVDKIRVLQRRANFVNSLIVHATEPYVLSASQDGRIWIWNYETEWERTFDAKSPVEHVAFNPKDTNMFASAQDKTVKIWDLRSDDCKLELSGHSDLVLCLDYFSLGDKLYLITGSQDKTAMIWDCKTKSHVQTLEGHTDVVKVACCHPDLQILITGSWDGSVRLWKWDSTTFRQERTLNFDLGEVYAIASLKGSTRIAVGNEKGLALVDIGLEDMKDDDVESNNVTMEEVNSSSTASNELVKVEPLELRLPIAQMVSSTVKIRNITDYHVAFSICPNNNTAKYSMSPSRGVLSPQSMQDYFLTWVSQDGVPADLKLKEVVIVNSTIVEGSLKTTDVTDEMFRTETGRNVRHVELAVVFVASEIIYKQISACTIDVHPTKPLMAITHGDRFVHIWDYRAKEEKTTIKNLEGKVSFAKFIYRGQRILTAARNELYWYDCDSLEETRVLQRRSKSIKSLAIHGTESQVLLASKDGTIMLYDYAKRWRLIKTFLVRSLMQVAFNPMDTNMFASAQDKTVKIWDRRHDKCQLTLAGHSDLIECFDYFIRRDDIMPYIITGSRDKTAKIWDCKGASCVQTLEGHAGPVRVVCFHPDVSVLITGCREGSIRLWNSTTFKLERLLNFDLGSLNSLACLKGSTRMIAIGNEKGLALVDIDPVDKKDGDGSENDMGPIMGEISSSSTASSELIKVDPLELRVPVAQNTIYKVKSVFTIDVHPTKPWMVITQADKFIRIWDHRKKKAEPFATKGTEVTLAKFIARKNWIMAGCSSGNIYVYRYDPVQKNPVKKIRVLQQRHSKSVNSFAVHATEPYVLSASEDGKILMWHFDEKEWELMKTFHAKSPVKHVAFTAKGIACAQDKTVKIWDLHSDDYKLELSGHSDLVLCLDSFSLGDKQYLITGSQDKTAKIWDCETGSCIQTLEGHTDLVKVACRHQDLRRLITGSCDGSVRLWKWDSTTFRQERTLNFDLGEVYAIASLKGSIRIAVGNEKGLALVDIDLEDKKDGEVEVGSSATASSDEPMAPHNISAETCVFSSMTAGISPKSSCLQIGDISKKEQLISAVALPSPVAIFIGATLAKKHVCKIQGAAGRAKMKPGEEFGLKEIKIGSNSIFISE